MYVKNETMIIRSQIGYNVCVYADFRVIIHSFSFDRDELLTVCHAVCGSFVHSNRNGNFQFIFDLFNIYRINFWQYSLNLVNNFFFLLVISLASIACVISIFIVINSFLVLFLYWSMCVQWSSVRHDWLACHEFKSEQYFLGRLWLH